MRIQARWLKLTAKNTLNCRKTTKYLSLNSIQACVVSNMLNVVLARWLMSVFPIQNILRMQRSSHQPWRLVQAILSQVRPVCSHFWRRYRGQSQHRLICRHETRRIFGYSRRIRRSQRTRPWPWTSQKVTICSTTAHLFEPPFDSIFAQHHEFHGRNFGARTEKSIITTSRTSAKATRIVCSTIILFYAVLICVNPKWEPKLTDVMIR